MKRVVCIAVFLFFLLGLSTSTQAANLGLNFLNPKRVEADPKKVYQLNEKNGPWMIMVKRFSGENAEENANKLIHELRSKYKLKAYLFDKEFKFNVSDGMKTAEQRQYIRERYATTAVQEYTVLVGDFQSAEDKDYQEALRTIKAKFPPEIIQVGRTQAPLLGAFGTLNPMLPPDIVNQKGYVDPFVERLNSDSKYSLLNNPGRFTVRVATFTGETIIKQDEVKQILSGRIDKKVTGKTLAQAGINASRLCAALREKGVEAYEFHDRYSSIVTVGSFHQVGSMDAMGMVEPIPEIARIFETYKGVYRQPTTDNMLPYMPKSLGGIEFDVQPTVIMVPKKMKR